MGQPDLLTGLLRDVSRSFYLTLRVLPGAVRPQIGVAYLLARATDTIADTAMVPVDRRIEVLELLRGYIGGKALLPPDMAAFAGQAPLAKDSVPQAAEFGLASPAERALLRRIEETVAALRRFSEADRWLIQATLHTISSGQILDLQRFANLQPGVVGALNSETDLDDYLYRVAGCVGEFWTRICRSHLFPTENVDDEALLKNGVRYGKGLQLTNILRDLPRDLRLGRCYLPVKELHARGLEPNTLLEAGNRQKLGEIVNHYCRIAIDHLRAGWAYTNSIPRKQVRIRLACAWPILIGKRTLELVGKGPLAMGGQPMKVSRTEVRRMIFKSVLAYPWRRMWDAQWEFGHESGLTRKPLEAGQKGTNPDD